MFKTAIDYYAKAAMDTALQVYFPAEADEDRLQAQGPDRDRPVENSEGAASSTWAGSQPDTVKIDVLDVVAVLNARLEQKIRFANRVSLCSLVVFGLPWLILFCQALFS